MRYLFVLTLVLFVVSPNFAQFKGESWSKVKSNGSGELSCVYYQTPGLVFKEDGKMQGVCIDIMNEFKKYVKSQYQVELTFNYLKKVPVFTDFIQTVRNGQDVMGICNTSITSEREKYLDFSPSYMNTPSVLLSNNDATVIRDFSQMEEVFKGYKAIIIKGSTHEKYLEKIAKEYFPSLEIEYLKSGEEVNAKLRSQEKCFTIIDFTEYFSAVRDKMNVTRHRVSLDELEDQLGFIFPKGSDWAKVWEEFLTPAFKESIVYKKILADNLGSSFVSLMK